MNVGKLFCIFPFKYFVGFFSSNFKFNISYISYKKSVLQIKMFIFLCIFIVNYFFYFNIKLKIFKNHFAPKKIKSKNYFQYNLYMKLSI